MSIIRNYVDKWAKRTHNRNPYPKEMPTKLVIAGQLYEYLQTYAPIAVFIGKLHLTDPFLKLIRKFSDRWLVLFYKEHPIYCDWPPEYYPEEGLDERYLKKRIHDIYQE